MNWVGEMYQVCMLYKALKERRGLLVLRIRGSNCISELPRYLDLIKS